MDGRVTRWAGQRERRRTEFIDAALHAIAVHGPDVTTEQITAAAGVSRPQLYKHFTDAADLRSAIADRATALLTASLAPLWGSEGSPRSMIRAAVDVYVEWMSANRNLYRFLDSRALTNVKALVGAHITTPFAAHLASFDADPSAAEPLAIGVVGLAEASTAHWLARADTPREEFTAVLADWVWCLLDHTLRGAGITVDPDAPLG